MVDHILRISAEPGVPAEAVLTCGTVEARYGGTVGMFDHLERPIAIGLEPEDALRRAFEALLEELLEPRLGSRILTEALLKQCLVLLIRRIAPDPTLAGWLLGSIDPRLAKSVLSLLEEPARDFSLEDLAQASGMSRSVFAERFQATFGRARSTCSSASVCTMRPNSWRKPSCRSPPWRGALGMRAGPTSPERFGANSRQTPEASGEGAGWKSAVPESAAARSGT